MIVSLIAAVAENGVIGKDGSMPWRLPADLRRFRQITMGSPLIMGRLTFESLPGPLEGRRNIVLSKKAKNYWPNGAILAKSVEGALSAAAPADEVFICGGGEVYREFIDRAERIYLTRVEAEIEGDTTFPEIDFSIWKKRGVRKFEADQENSHPTAFMILERD